MKHNITELEAKLLNELAYHEFCATNGMKPEQASDVWPWLWVDELASDLNMTMPEVKGILGSIVKKGWAVICEGDKRRGDDDSIYFTQDGFKAWQTIDDDRSE